MPASWAKKLVPGLKLISQTSLDYCNYYTTWIIRVNIVIFFANVYTSHLYKPLDLPRRDFIGLSFSQLPLCLVAKQLALSVQCFLLREYSIFALNYGDMSTEKCIAFCNCYNMAGSPALGKQLLTRYVCLLDYSIQSNSSWQHVPVLPYHHALQKRDTLFT